MSAKKRNAVAMMQDVYHVYLVALVCINTWFLATALSNVVYFHRATKKPRIKGGPFVSVIVPARNEERVIGGCLQSLLKQDYANFEVIVVDDESSDATAAVARSVAKGDPRLRVVFGTPLPEGWLGKSHALSEGVAVARGEILILTDADTVHEPDSISWAVTNLQDHRADMLSGYLNQKYGSLGERIIVPTMYAMMLLVPFYLLPRTKNPQLAFAIGQYVAVRRQALDAVGGFEAIKGSIVDDMSMATHMKELGYCTVFLDAKEAASCRLYRGYRDAFEGIERSSYSAVGGRPLTVVALMVVVLGIIVWPALSLLMSSARFDMPVGPLAVSVVLFALQWAFIAWDRNVPFIAFILYPLVFLNLIIIMNASMLRTGFGRGAEWKGRIVRMPRNSGATRAECIADSASSPGKAK